MTLVRLDKALGEQGGWSRKEIKQMASKGLIQVNGKPEKDSSRKIDREQDTVTVQGKQMELSEHSYILLNKPKGYVSATEDNRDKTVLELIPERLKRRGLFPAGRLDKDTTGMMLITDDGAFAHRILSPVSHIPKTYLAELDIPVTEEMEQAFRSGIPLKGEGECLPARLVRRGERTAEVTICEGMYHQIKRMFGVCGAEVLELRRIAMGSLPMDETLKEGECRLLTKEELELLSRRAESNSF